MQPELILGGALLLGLFLYFLFGGADFGGGVWDLLATGPRKSAQRELIGHAIGPVWEANHVWLIFAIVMLFSAFPKAFSALSIALHVPLTLFLIGIIFRGSAFAFRSVDYKGDVQQRRWGRVFAVASVSAPVLLGMCVGALASGQITVKDGTVTSGFYDPWLGMFPLAVGIFALSLCAFLAATFLAYEAEDPGLKEDFRLRALLSGFAVGAIALIAILLSKSGAPLLYEGLTERGWTWPFHLTTGLAAVGALISLAWRRYGLARIFAGAQVLLVLTGWALSQYPYLVVPDLTLTTSGGNDASRRAILWALAFGMPVLLPSLWLLFRIFKTRSSPLSAP